MTITALYRYPVKSMLGESLARATLGERGLVGDRAYALLDVETGNIASAKVPRRWARLLDFAARFTGEPVPGEPPPPVEITFPDGSTRRSDDPDIDGALSAVLEREVKLITVAPENGGFEELWPDIEGLAPEPVIEATTARHEDSGEVISRFDLAATGPAGTFFDLSAIHVLTESTLDRLRDVAPEATFDARRYRPNVVLAGTGEGFVENEWPGTEMTLGDGVRLAYLYSTMRCVMTTLGQQELPEDRNTLRAIAKHNRIEIPQLGGMWACAGVYADVRAGGAVSVGDAHG